jgi:hypothetical protein
MQLDFVLQEEPLDKLVPAYIELEVKDSGSSVRERAQREVVLLNSILVGLAAQKEGLAVLLSEVNYWLEVNEHDKKSMDRAAMLLGEVIRRSQHILS